MKCPVCKTPDLLMSERQGIEIDYCPSCRGIWLDRGELDKIIDKSMSQDLKNAPSHSTQSYSKEHKKDSYEYQKHRKKHWLSELFD